MPALPPLSLCSKLTTSLEIEQKRTPGILVILFIYLLLFTGRAVASREEEVGEEEEKEKEVATLKTTERNLDELMPICLKHICHQL